jgi:hypothetical protein
MSDGLPDFVEPGTQVRDITIPRFYMRPVHNAWRSKQEGRPIFDEVEYVEIIIPGQRSTVDERVKDEHKRNWAARYKAFKDGLEVAQDGTPLEEWPGVTRSQVEELKFFHVRTVETLAALDDGGLQRAVPMGGHALRAAAKRYLEQAADRAPAERLAAENDQLRGKMATMEEKMATMEATIRELQAKHTGGGQ